jgi:hypothetical protein
VGIQPGGDPAGSWQLVFNSGAREGERRKRLEVDGIFWPVRWPPAAGLACRESAAGRSLEVGAGGGSGGGCSRRGGIGFWFLGLVGSGVGAAGGRVNVG